MIYFSDKVYVSAIAKKGLGVRAKVPFKEGDIIEVSPTIGIAEKDEDIIYTFTDFSSYIFDYQGKSALGLGYSSLYNHSKTPNAIYALTDRTIIIRAIKNIKVHEEISIDYGWPKEMSKKFK